MDWICRNCGKEFNGDFATKWGNCPSLTGCGSTNIRRKNEFDDLRPVDLAETLVDLQGRLSDLERELHTLRQYVPE